MKLSKIAETTTAVGAAALAGINAYQHKQKEHKCKKSLIAAGLALWEIKKHHHQVAA